MPPAFSRIRIFPRTLPSAWLLFTGAIAALVLVPILCVLSSVFGNSSDVWQHLSETVLGLYITNSLWLSLGVSGGVLVIGVGTAWLVTMCRFPGSRVFEWALLLPLAAPAYLLAYVYTELLEFYGPIQTFLRQTFLWENAQDYWFPNIRSIGGAIAMLTLVLYPYVYLLARVAFLEQSVRTLEASRSLGCNPWRSFFSVALPLARPSIVAGLALVLMETLSDFGTVEFFSVDTFTTGIYRTWFGMGDRQASMQLAAVLTIFVLWLILLEAWSRRQARYFQVSSRYQSLPRFQLGFIRGSIALIFCFLPIAFGFLLPVGILTQMSIDNMTETFGQNFGELSLNSFLLAAITASIGVVIASIVSYGKRLNSHWTMNLAVRTASIGYAIPGSVIAVGIMIPLGSLDNWIDGWMRSNFDISTGLLLSGTIAALIFAYLVRFLAVSLNTVESSLNKIKPSFDDAAHSLGYGATATFLKIHLPLIWSGLLTAIMLLFVDVMKELPITLVIRPFNFDTLAIRVYSYASDERLAEAAAPALAIILVGILPVIFLSIRIARSNPDT